MLLSLGAQRNKFIKKSLAYLRKKYNTTGKAFVLYDVPVVIGFDGRFEFYAEFNVMGKSGTRILKSPAIGVTGSTHKRSPVSINLTEGVWAAIEKEYH